MIEAAGVDTWSVAWYLGEGSSAHRAIDALATEQGPRSRLIPEAVADHRVGWFPGSRLLFAEGHPAPGALAKSHELPGAFQRLSEALNDRGVLPPAHRRVPRVQPVYDGKVRMAVPDVGGTGFAGVRRLDSTVDLRFDDPLEGLCALAGVAALPIPRCKTKVIREAGGRRVETVYFHGYGGKRVLGRWYDKGIESGDAARGAHVRPEDQRRYSAEVRPPLEALAETTYIRDQFVKRFETLWSAAKGVKVGGVLELAKRLDELVGQGAISQTAAKRIAGHLVLDAAGCQHQSRSTRLRDRADARRHGLVLADGLFDEVEVDLGEVLERAMDSEAWGAQG